MYSPTWFECFLRRIPPEQTRREVDFLARQLPLPAFGDVLDICCGEGRHAAEMSRRGYAVTGVDRDQSAIARACANAPAARFIVANVRELSALGGPPFDAAVCLWQTFGYFDPDTNAAILRDIAARLRPSGRLVLDMCHRLYFESRAGEREFVINGKQVVERRTVTGGHLRVELSFDKAEVDLFQWQLYTPDELIDVGQIAGVSLVLACSGFDETKQPSAETSRYQLVLERAQA